MPPPRSILVVDDVASERQTLCALCDVFGFQPLPAASAAEAAALLVAHRPAAAIVDLVMPGADGLDCLFMIARMAPETVVAVTTASETLLLKAALELTVHYGLPDVAALPKPIRRGALASFLAMSGLLRPANADPACHPNAGLA